MDRTIAATGLAGQSGVPRQAGAGREARTAGPKTWGAATGQLVVGAVPEPAPGLLPRPALLAQLNEPRGQAPVVQVVTGPPGAGKTQLAAAYARAKLKGEWRLVAWVNAGNAGILLEGLAAVADAAGLSDSGPGGEAAEAGRAVRQLLQADGERCLLVFDDVEDPGIVRPFVPADGAAQVLIITREPAVNLETSIRVDVFSEEEALAFLDGQTGLGEAGAASVAAELGYLPLALAQAAAVISGHQLGYESYLERLNALPLQAYLSPEQEQPFPRGIAESAGLSLDAAEASDTTGVSSRVMEILAVLSPAGVSRELLHSAGQNGALASGGRQVTSAAVDRALESLAERSLLRASLDGQTVVVHRLTMRVVRETLARKGRLKSVCRVAASVLEAQVDALTRSRDRRAVGDVPEQVTALMTNTARLADATSQELAGALLNLERLLGRDHPYTLHARDSLAAAYQSAGLSVLAIPVFELTLTARDRLLGSDHPDTTRSRSNLASAYRKAGQSDRAIPLVAQLLGTRERLLGADHPRTLAAQNNLAVAYREAGRAAEAIPLFEQNLAACERLLGPDDRRTQTARRNLALARQEAGHAE